MQRLPRTLIDQLDLRAAASAEAAAWRNLLPPEPWVQAVNNNPVGFADWVAARLESGAHNAQAVTVSARKSNQGTRPVPIVGIAERIAYRALADFVLRGLPPAARAPEDFQAFAGGPITYAFTGLGAIRRLGDARLAYVVEADIAAFYQYVDHDLLRREIEMQTGEVAGAGYLAELLLDIQGSSFGLPQLLDASDALSEVYVRVMERDIVRRGLLTWRYNDDFRIGTTSYDAAQDAIEQVADAARHLGLILNEHKTYISRFMTYLFRYRSPDANADKTQFDPEDLQIPTDYDLDDDEAAEAAVARLARLDLKPDDERRIDLKGLSGEDIRDLRSAVTSLRRLQHPGALSRVVHLCLFAPALTPRLAEYLIDMHAAEAQTVEQIWDTLTQKHASSLSEWQTTWLVYTARRLGLLQASEDRTTFVRAQRLRGKSGLLHAESSLALAEVGGIDFSDLDVALRDQPEALAPWYALGIRALSNGPGVDQQRLTAVKNSSPLYRLLIES